MVRCRGFKEKQPAPRLSVFTLSHQENGVETSETILLTLIAIPGVSLDAHASWLNSYIKNEDGNSLPCWIHLFDPDGKPKRYAWSRFL